MFNFPTYISNSPNFYWFFYSNFHLLYTNAPSVEISAYSLPTLPYNSATSHYRATLLAIISSTRWKWPVGVALSALRAQSSSISK